MLLLTGLIICTCGSFSYAEESTRPTIPQLNQLNEPSRVYEFLTGETAILEENAGTTASGEFSIKGIDKTGNSILFNGYSGFVVSRLQTTLNISDVTVSEALSAVGSVIYNTATDSVITLKNVNLNGNSTLSQSNAYGGAIYSRGHLTLTNVNLTGNSAVTQDPSSVARGGAIYARNAVTYIADGEKTEISGNYTEDAVNGRTDNAVYMASSTSSLTMSAKNNGKIDLKNSIDGMTGYDVNLTGDGTGKIGVFGDIKNGDVSVSNVDISFSDGETTEHRIDNLDIGNNVNFIIDADFQTQKADTLTSPNGTGTMNISDMNIIGAPTGDSATVQVLKNAGNIRLNIDKLLENVVSEVQPTMYNNSIIADSVALATTSTENDSITISGMKDVLYEMINDREPMHMIKNFIFRTDTEYTLTKDLPITPQESILSIYNTSNSDYGVINANGHSMFKMKNPISSVYLKDITIKNASSDDDGSVVYLENNSASFTTDNAVITNNTSSADGGAIYAKSGSVTMTDTTLSNNTAGGSGGAMYVTDDSTVELTNVDFKNNTAGDKGGAIYTNKDILITAQNGSSTIEGNTANGENNGIYVGSSDATVTFNAQDNGVINLNDKIEGTPDRYGVDVVGTENGNVNLNNSITNANVSLNGTNLNMAHDNLMQGDNFNGLGGTLNMQNNEVGNADFNTLSMNGKMNLKVDVNLEDKTMDRINADNYGEIKGTVNVSSMNLVKDTERKVTRVFFADDPLKKHVKTTVKKVYSRVYKYIVSYDSSDGYFVFGRSGGHNPNPGDFNPAVLGGSVAQHIGHMSMMLDYDYAMYHSFTYMMLPKYARDNLYRDPPSEVEPNDPYYNPSFMNVPEEVKSIWVRPYSSFESIPFHKGPKVTAINYGILAGGDSDLIDLGHGFRFVYGGYMGYNGTSYHYSNVDATQQGAVLGLTANIYKGNFYNTLTTAVGWQINDTDTSYGSDIFNLIMAGFSDRMGYNIELAKGKFIIQPQLAMGYTFVWMDDYTASTGAKVQTEPLHAMHFIPGVKFVANLRNGWQPYGIVNVICTFCDKTRYYADGYPLPATSLDPYVEFGLGVQKRWADKYSGFMQATARAGGRRGAALVFGFRCMMGKLIERTANIIHEDPKPKKVFKEKKEPEIVIKTKDKDKPAVKEPKRAEVKEKKSHKFSIKNIFKKVKDKIFYRYNTDVSAKVVTDVHPDGVIMPNISGMKRRKDESLMDYKDEDRIESLETLKQQPENRKREMYINPDPKELNKGEPQKIDWSKPIEKPKVNIETKPVVKQDTKPVVKQELPKKTEVMPSVKQEVKTVVKQEVRTVVESKKVEVKKTPVVKQEVKPAVKQEAKPVAKKEVKPVVKKEPIKQEVKPNVQKNKDIPNLKLDSNQDVKLIIKQPEQVQKPKQELIEPVFVGNNGEPAKVKTAPVNNVSGDMKQVQSAVNKPAIVKTEDVRPVKVLKTESPNVKDTVKQEVKPAVQPVQPIKQTAEPVVKEVEPVKKVIPAVNKSVENVVKNKTPKMEKTLAIKKYKKPRSKSLYINQTQYMKPKRPAVFNDYSVDVVNFKF